MPTSGTSPTDCRHGDGAEADGCSADSGSNEREIGVAACPADPIQFVEIQIALLPAKHQIRLPRHPNYVKIWNDGFGVIPIAFARLAYGGQQIRTAAFRLNGRHHELGQVGRSLRNTTEAA